MALPSAGFHVSNGKIIDPDGNVFVAKGLNMGSDVDPTQVLRDFPGLTFVRLAVSGYPSAASLQNIVKTLTDAKVVVEIEDHPWPLMDALTGSALNAETNWYSSLASAFNGNPYVWFGSMNEPQWDGHENISAQQSAIYDAIRGAGNNTMIMMESGIGSGDPGSVGAGVLDPATYAHMTNIAWDLHFYGWVLDDNNTSQSYADSRLLGQATPDGEGAGAGVGVLGAQTIQSADGVVPVIVGEFGHSTEVNTAEGDRVIQAVNDATQNGEISGFAAWAWHPSEFQEEWLVDNSGNVTRWGNQLESAIQSITAPTPPPTTPTPIPPPTATPEQVTAIRILPGQGSFTDAAGNSYVLGSDGRAMENGQPIPGGAGTSAMELYNAQVYGQDAASGSWYTWDQSMWSSASAPPAPSDTPTSPLPTGTTVGSGSDQIVITMSEDPDGPIGAAGRDAQFTLNVDGQQIGGLQTVTALHGSGQTQTFNFLGNWGPGAHAVTITFANNSNTQGDKLSPYDGGDRNLYVESIAYDGTAVKSTVTPIYESPIFPPNSADGVHPGNAVFTVTDSTAIPANAPSTPTTTPGPISAGSGADHLTLMMAEDPYQGDASFTVAVDGKQVGGTFTTTAVAWEGQQQEFDLFGSWGSGAHTLTVSYVNDAMGQTDASGNALDAQDRNLYVMGANYNGAAVPGTPWELSSNGSKAFSVASTGTTSPPPPSTPPSSDAVLIKPGIGSFKDAAGNSYSLSAAGSAMENNGAIPGGGGTKAMEYANGTVYGQDANSGNWYTWNQQTWASSSAPPPATVSPHTLSLILSEDRYQGDAQFIAKVDGTQVMGPASVTALHNQGATQTFSYAGMLSTGAHDLEIDFINDAWGGSASTDRNLYINQVKYDGSALLDSTQGLYSQGAVHIAFGNN